MGRLSNLPKDNSCCEIKYKINKMISDGRNLRSCSLKLLTVNIRHLRFTKELVTEDIESLPDLTLVAF